MKLPKQINGEHSFGKQPRQGHRVYSKFASSVTCQCEGGVIKILLIYEK